MKVPRKAKLEKVVSKDQSRPVLASLYLRIIGEGEDRRGYLEATDSYKLARVPVDVDDEDTEGFIPAEVLVAARKANRLTPTLTANGSLDIPGGPSFPRPELGTFPNTDQLLPDESKLAEFAIGLNAKLLYELAQGLGSETVRLRFVGGDFGSTLGHPSSLRPMVVTPIHGDEPDAVGILMPIRLSG